MTVDDLPPLPRGVLMGSGIFNGTRIDLFMHSNEAMQAYALAAVAQAENTLMVDVNRYRKWRADHTNPSKEPSNLAISIADAWEPHEVDAAIDAAIEATKEQS